MKYFKVIHIILVLGLLITIASYYPAINSPFFSDDFVYIVGNKNFETPLWDIWKFFFQRTNPYEYLPIRDVSYRIDYEIFGLNVIGYRIQNFIFYLVSCLLIWLSLKELLKFFESIKGIKFSEWLPVAATILFAAHPVHVESVVWISGRKEILSSLFMFGSFYQILKYFNSDEISKKSLFLGYFFYICALLSKAVIVPYVLIAILIPLIKYGFDKSKIDKLIWYSVPFLVFTFLFLLIYIIVGSETKILNQSFIFGSQAAFKESFYFPILLLGYLTKIAIFPINPRLIYDVHEVGFPFISSILLGSVILLLALYGIIRVLKNKSLIYFALFFGFVFCLPFLQIIRFATWSFVSDRFLYIPVFGLSLIISLLIFKFKKNWSVILIVILFAGYLVSSFNYSFKWRSEKDLLTYNAKFSPKHAISQQLYIDKVLFESGDYEAAHKVAEQIRGNIDREVLKRYINAWEAYEKKNWEVVDLNLNWLEYIVGANGPPVYLAMLADNYKHKGDFYKASEYYFRAMNFIHLNNVRRDLEQSLNSIRKMYEPTLKQLEMLNRKFPNDINIIGELANTQLGLFMLEEAEQNYRNILQKHPNNGIAHYNLALTLMKKKNIRQGISEFVQAIRLGFDEAFVLNNLALAYQESGQNSLAEETFKQAIKKDPKYWYASFNLGRLYWMNGQKEKALEIFQDLRTSVIIDKISSDFIDYYINLIKKEE